MHSNAQQTTRPTASPRGDGRLRRLGAILAVTALPLIAVACGESANTNVGAGGAAAGPSATPTQSDGGATPSSTSGTSSSGTAGNSGNQPSSQEPPMSSQSSQSSQSEQSSGGTPVPDSVKGSAYTATSIKGRPAVKGSPLKISFDASGERSGLHAGCNSMGGAPVFDGDALSIPQIVSTMMACEAGGGVIMEQESWYSKWLTEGVSYTVDGTTLTLEGAGVTVVFERSGDADAAPSRTEDPASPTSDGGMTTQAETGPVVTPRTPISGATIELGTMGTAIPIPPTTR
ncbi:META domain-containing protein [Nakamurella sp. A5-74]|uniref:META domain-containing protein n=1 Tax=Nakamurella sp. A5-74 TaxID=3158264 RepID=A0AAU8DKR2_9ACTN